MPKDSLGYSDAAVTTFLIELQNKQRQQQLLLLLLLLTVMCFCIGPISKLVY